MIELIKQRCLIDDILSWLYVLVMMDDTVILSTTREGRINKIQIMHEFCRSYVMIVNNSKTKFMVLNVAKIKNL